MVPQHTDSDSQPAIVGQTEEIVGAQAQRHVHLEPTFDETRVAEQKFATLLDSSNSGGEAGEHAGIDFQRLASAVSHNPELEAAIGRRFLQLTDVGDNSSFDGKRMAALQMKAAAQAAQIKEMKQNEEAHLATIAQLRQEAGRDVRRNCELEVEVDKMQQVVQDYLAQIGKLRNAVTQVDQQEASMKEMRVLERDLRVQVTELKAVISDQSKRIVELEADVLAMSQREQDYEWLVSQLQDVVSCTEADAPSLGRRNAELADAASCGRRDAELAAEPGVSQQQQQQQGQQQQHGQGPPPPPQCENQRPNNSMTDIGLCKATLPPEPQQGTLVATHNSGATVATVTVAISAPNSSGMAGGQPAAIGQEMASKQHLDLKRLELSSLPAKAGMSKENPAGGSVLIGCSGSAAATKRRSSSVCIAGGIPLGSRHSGSNTGSISGSFAPMWRKPLGFSGSVEVEASTAAIHSPPVPQSAQRMQSKPEDARRSPSRMHRLSSPQRVRVASPIRVGPATCTAPVQMAPPIATVRAPSHRPSLKDGQTTSQIRTFTPYNTRGASPVMSTKKLGGSVCLHATSYVRKASPDHVYPLREYANKTSY